MRTGILSSRRYVVVGAGAVGGAVGATLHRAGRDVTLVARGAHLEAIRAHGLVVTTPAEEHVVRVPAVASAREVAWRDGDVALVCVKSQDTAGVVEDLAAAAPRGLAVVSLQNGVNAPGIAERFAATYGAVIFAPLQHLEPGRVSIHTAPSHGGIDLGVWPVGVDATCDEVRADLRAAGFDARVEPRIARMTYAKLLSNLGNALDALGGRAALTRERVAVLRAEAEACFAAARIEHAPLPELYARFADVREAGDTRGGGSTWQSLARGQPLETEHLNGEVVRLGLAHGVPTPVNAALLALSRRAAVEHRAPGSMSVAEIDAALAGT